jgi:hypothetical protein
MSVPVIPAVGVKLVIVGAGTKVNVPKDAVPPMVVTATGPVAPGPTVAKTWVDVNEVIVAGTPPIVTPVTVPVNAPLIVMGVPAPPVKGVKPEMVGAGTNVNGVPGVVAVPPGVVTLTE